MDLITPHPRGTASESLKIALYIVRGS
ncbi:hypothetical protein GGD38_004383 [Chitinophagaceae bacterium OAS944]|nr:hypothetical protein [Chitinophagaceae bacterium OAS944]